MGICLFLIRLLQVNLFVPVEGNAEGIRLLLGELDAN